MLRIKGQSLTVSDKPSSLTPKATPRDPSKMTTTLSGLSVDSGATRSRSEGPAPVQGIAIRGVSNKRTRDGDTMDVDEDKTGTSILKRPRNKRLLTAPPVANTTSLLNRLSPSASTPAAQAPTAGKRAEEKKQGTGNDLFSRLSMLKGDGERSRLPFWMPFSIDIR